MVFDKLKNPYWATFALWLSAAILAVITSNSVVAAITLFFTGLLPFIFLVLWFSRSETGISIRRHFEKWHIAVMLTWVLFAYTLYARKWAASLINEVFHIDASSLGITYTLLAALYTPFGILYQKAILAGILNAIVVVALIWGGLLPLLLILPIKFKKIIKVFGVTFLIILLSSFFITILANLSLHKESLIKEFAVWADFNAKHLCSNDWAKTAQGVVFLGGDRVLTYIPTNPNGSRFVPATCNYTESF